MSPCSKVGIGLSIGVATPLIERGKGIVDLDISHPSGNRSIRIAQSADG
jgi:uncharacterized UPF0146 family protein